MAQSQSVAKPWYKELWFWLLISPMLTLIVTVPIMLTTAFKHADDRVIDNYYKEGRMINYRFEAERVAFDNKIAGMLEFDWEVGELWFTANQSLSDNQLSIQFSHPAKAENDFELILRKSSARRFRADLPSMPKGRWYIYLLGSINQQAWRIPAEFNLTDVSQIELKPASH